MNFDTILQQLNQFWEIVKDVWVNGIFGADLGSYLLALVVITLFWILRRAFTLTVIGIARRMTAKTQTGLDDTLLDTVEGPAKFLFIVLGFFFGFQILPLNPEWDARAELVISSLVLVTIFWVLHNAIGPIVTQMRKRITFLNGAIADWVERGLKVIVILLAAAGILETWGIPVAPIIGGLGLFGVAVALGAQDLFKNLIAGVLILSERRFRKGDWIKVEGVAEGTVEHIGFRSTKIRRFDKAPLQVPNAQLSDNPVTNFSEMTFRRIYWTIGVTYDTSIEQLRDIRDQIEDYIFNDGAFAAPTDAAAFVRIDKFNDSSIDIMLYCFTKTTVWGEWLQEKERLAYKVKEIVEGAGSSFAFPSQSLYLESVPDNAPETFVPPQSSGEAAKAPAKAKKKPDTAPKAGA